MNPTSESFDQPTEVGKTGGKKLTPKQKATIFAGLGGAAALAGGSALAWGMSQDGTVNDNHPQTETKPASESHGKVEEPKPATETPSDSTKVNPAPHSDVAPDSKTNPESTPSKTESNETDNTNEPMVATHVTDEMSFEDAFKTARQEVGPGGYFEWNGQLYNTYYKEEWNALSTQERQEYAATVHDENATETHHGSSNYSTASYDSSKADIKVGNYEGHVVGLGDIDHDGDSEVMVIDGTSGAIDKDNDGIMETRVQLDPNTHEVIAQAPLTTTFAAPQMDSLESTHSQPVSNETAESKPDVHTTEFQGHVVILGDTNHDGDAEVLIIDGTSGVVDVDNDGIMETQVKLDPTTHEVIAQAPMTEVYHAPAMNAFDAPQNQNTPSSNQTNPDVEVITVTHEGHEVKMGDSNHDGYVDVVILDNGKAVADTDGDHQFDTAVQVDLTTGEVVATAPLEHPFEAPTMDSVSPEENTTVAHDFDNNADVSDWVA